MPPTRNSNDSMMPCPDWRPLWLEEFKAWFGACGDVVPWLPNVGVGLRRNWRANSIDYRCVPLFSVIMWIFGKTILKLVLYQMQKIEARILLRFSFKDSSGRYCTPCLRLKRPQDSSQKDLGDKKAPELMPIWLFSPYTLQETDIAM